MIALLLKASLIAAILLAFYKLFLEKESFFSANRLFLIATILLTFLLPFISVPELINDQGFVSAIIDKTEKRESLAPSEVQPNSESGKTSVEFSNESITQKKVGLLDWLLRLYYFGVAIISLNLILQVGRLLIKAKKSADKIYDTDGVIISKSPGQSPCSFFHYVFVNPEDYDFETYEQILEHEKIHVRKLHALDLLLAEIAIIFLWFNPAVWILKTEIEKNIEYETDDLMLKRETVEKENYQMNLLAVATHAKPLVVTTNYNQSMIKQRIVKMNTKKSNPHSYWKYTFTVPLIFGMLLTINRPLAAVPVKDDDSVINRKTETAVAGGCADLLQAVKDENIEMVKELLKTVDPDCSYRGGGEPRSPLVAAARAGNLAIARQLVDANADVEFHASGDETPLMAAAARGHLELVKYLVSNKAKVNRTLGGDGSALLVASRGGRLETVKYLISAGADVNAQITGDGTALICAVRNNHYEVSKVLLENGADPYQNSPGDEYAMFHARSSNNKAMINLLKRYDKEN